MLNIHYDPHFQVSILELELLLSAQEEIPWPALWYVTGEVTYGGRVTDDLDRRCLQSLLQKFYHPRALEPNYAYSADGVSVYPQDYGSSTFDLQQNMSLSLSRYMSQFYLTANTKMSAHMLSSYLSMTPLNSLA